MKKIMYVMFALLMGVGTVLGEGGKNQGDTGTGETATGEEAQGDASQDRAGRDDSSRLVEFIEQGE